MPIDDCRGDPVLGALALAFGCGACRYVHETPGMLVAVEGGIEEGLGDSVIVGACGADKLPCAPTCTVTLWDFSSHALNFESSTSISTIVLSAIFF